MRHQSIYSRLRRIEGQIRGIEDMLDKNRSDEEILVQLEAAKSSLASTIGSLIEAMMTKDTDGRVLLNETSVRAVLRMVKKG